MLLQQSAAGSDWMDSICYLHGKLMNLEKLDPLLQVVAAEVDCAYHLQQKNKEYFVQQWSILDIDPVILKLDLASNEKN